MSIPLLPSYSLPDVNTLPENKVGWQVDLSRCALLIHDMQEYFLGFYGDTSPLRDNLKANIASLRNWAKKNQVPIIYTAQPIEQSAEDRALLNDMWGPGLTQADPDLQKITSQLTPDTDDTVLVKWRYSAFHRSELQDILKAAGRDQLVICGVYAHIGCLATALDAFMYDIQSFAVADALGDFSEADHKMALNFIAGRCGSVVTSGQLISIGQSTAPDLDWASIKLQLVEMIDESPELFDPEENLIDYGLDSIQLMTLISRWQANGVHLKFEELASAPSLNNWWGLIVKKYPELTSRGP